MIVKERQNGGTEDLQGLLLPWSQHGLSKTR